MSEGGFNDVAKGWVKLRESGINKLVVKRNGGDGDKTNPILETIFSRRLISSSGS